MNGKAPYCPDQFDMIEISLAVMPAKALATGTSFMSCRRRTTTCPRAYVSYAR